MMDETKTDGQVLKGRLLAHKIERTKTVLKCIASRLLSSGRIGACAGCQEDALCGKIKSLVRDRIRG